MSRLLARIRGGAGSPPRPRLVEILWSAVGGFLGIGVVALIDYRVLGDADMAMMMGSFGASAVLVFGAARSPLSQPRNFVGGHVVSAAAGVLTSHLLLERVWLAAPVAVAAAIALMHVTKTLHPPGGATALIAVVGDSEIRALGFLYILMPVAAGAAVMLAIALVVNNIPRNKRYPAFWF